MNVLKDLYLEIVVTLEVKNEFGEPLLIEYKRFLKLNFPFFNSRYQRIIVTE